MNRVMLVCLLALCSIASLLAMSLPLQQTTQAQPSSHQSKATIEGLIRDIACPIQNFEAKGYGILSPVRVGVRQAWFPVDYSGDGWGVVYSDF